MNRRNFLTRGASVLSIAATHQTITGKSIIGHWLPVLLAASTITLGAREAPVPASGSTYQGWKSHCLSNGLVELDESVLIAGGEFALVTGGEQQVALFVRKRHQEQAISWRFTTGTLADAWSAPAFDDAAWNQGPAPFGVADSTVARKPRTEWNTAD